MATSEDNNSLEICCGLLEKNFIGLVINLEQQLDAFVRPFPGIRREENTVSIALGLQKVKDSDRTAIEQIVKYFFTISTHQSSPIAHSFTLLTNPLDRLL